MLKKQLRRKKIRSSIRKKLRGTAERPRLSVYRSNKDIYVQLIDDVSGVTLAAASSFTKEAPADKANKVDRARQVGQAIAEKAKASGITTVVFDRGGYLYHGRVKSLAEGAREAGLQF